MKKIVIIICLIMVLTFSSQAQIYHTKKNSKPRTLVITKLNTDSIKIGDRNYTVRDTFSDNEVIHWSSAKQAMWVKYTDGVDREKKCLTQEAFAKRKAKSPHDYFDKINHPSKARIKRPNQDNNTKNHPKNKKQSKKN